ISRGFSRWDDYPLLRFRFGVRRWLRHSVAADDRDFVRFVLYRFVKALTRHRDEIRLLFVNERRAVLHTETQNFFVVLGSAGRAIFHISFLVLGFPGCLISITHSTTICSHGNNRAAGPDIKIKTAAD